MRRRKSGGDVHGAPGLPRIIGWARSNVAKSGRIRADVENSSHEDFKGFKLRGVIAEHSQTLGEWLQALEGRQLLGADAEVQTQLNEELSALDMIAEGMLTYKRFATDRNAQDTLENYQLSIADRVLKPTPHHQ